MRCLLCGKNLPLRRRLQRRLFCNDSHQEQFSQLTLARLMSDKRQGPPTEEPEPRLTPIEANCGASQPVCEPVPREASLLKEMVGPANRAAEPLGRVGVLLRVGSIWPPAVTRTTARRAPSLAERAAVRIPLHPGLVNGDSGGLGHGPAIPNRSPIAASIRLHLRRAVWETSRAPLAAGLRAIHSPAPDGKRRPAVAVMIRSRGWPKALSVHAPGVRRQLPGPAPRSAHLAAVWVDQRGPRPYSVSSVDVMPQSWQGVLPVLCGPPIASLRVAGAQMLGVPPLAGLHAPSSRGWVRESAWRYIILKPLFRARKPRLEALPELAAAHAAVVTLYQGWRQARLAAPYRWRQQVAIPGLPGKPSGLLSPSNSETETFLDARLMPAPAPEEEPELIPVEPRCGIPQPACESPTEAGFLREMVGPAIKAAEPLGRLGVLLRVGSVWPPAVTRTNEWRAPSLARAALIIPLHPRLMSGHSGESRHCPPLPNQSPIAASIRLPLRQAVRETSCAPLTAGPRAIHSPAHNAKRMPAVVAIMRRWAWPKALAVPAAGVARQLPGPAPRSTHLAAVKVDPRGPRPYSVSSIDVMPQSWPGTLPALCGPPVSEASLEPAKPRAAVVTPCQGWRRARLAAAHRWGQRLAIPRLRGKPSGLPILPGNENGHFREPPLTPAPEPGLTPRLWKTWHLTPPPARAAILALPFVISIGIALVPRVKPYLRQMECSIRERAAIVLTDDFSSGLSGWSGGPDWASDWAYDQAGLVRPGRLALLNASVPLRDYRFEFGGQIRKKSLSWAFRASDVRNYYAIKIIITKPGPLPSGIITRYTVVNGVALDRVQLPLFLNLRSDSIYKVETRVYQDSFITSINGQIVDTFSDRRHSIGGVGLFSGPDEDARVLWVKVADQDDFLGRICAYFSSHSADSKAGVKPIVRTKALTIKEFLGVRENP